MVANKEKDCNGVLKRSDWIPAFDNWKVRLQIKNMTSFSFWSTIDKRPKHRLWLNDSESYAGIVDIRNDLLVSFAPMLGQDAAILQNEQKRKYLLSTTKAQNRAKQLLALGSGHVINVEATLGGDFSPASAARTRALRCTHFERGLQKKKSEVDRRTPLEIRTA